MPRADWGAIRRCGPELGVAALAVVIFLGFLGSVDLWGKREQRAAAEALDTVQHGHWLIAQIQGRPRLEKPPLPRWAVAGLMTISGRSDEWIVRLPGALAALGCVAVVYDLGRRLGGRSVGLASALVVCSTGYFISETRQGGNDGPLALFTALSLYAAWRRLHGGLVVEGESPSYPADEPGPRGWALLMGASLGLGFLTKGPVILLLVGLTVVPYLAFARRLGRGLRLLLDLRGLAAFVLIALSWPLPVVIFRPESLGVWYLEIFQKAGSAGVEQHKDRALLVAEWLWMALPWTPLALLSALFPFLGGRSRVFRPHVWFFWMWAFANLGMFSLWTVSKPNYYVPCLPGLAVLVGLQWTRLVELARGGAVGALRLLQLHWVLPFVAGVILPVVAAQRWPEYTGPASVLGGACVLGAVASALAWRRGAVAGSLAPLASILVVTITVVYGWVGPEFIRPHSFRTLATTLQRVVPDDTRTIMFFDELDEGLWFYLRDRQLARVPGSGPELNHAYDMMVEARQQRLIRDPNQRAAREQAVLMDWLARGDHASPYVLIRRKVYDVFAPALAGRVEVVFQEPELRRHGIVLVKAPAAVAPERLSTATEAARLPR